MNIISKDKPKGNEYSKHKKMKKAKRLQEEKKFRRLTENKRKNAENRKERELEKQTLNKIREVVLKDFVKGMFIILIEGKEEKRAPLIDKNKFSLKNIEDTIGNVQIKLYGNYYNIKELSNFDLIKEETIFNLKNEL